MGKAMPDSKHLRWNQDVGKETEDATEDDEPQHDHHNDHPQKK